VLLFNVSRADPHHLAGLVYALGAVVFERSASRIRLRGIG